MDSHEPTSLDEEVAALSRSADRDSLFMQARIVLAGQSEPLVVRVRNLSAGGMLAEGKVRGEPLVTGVVGLDGVEQAFADLGNPERHAKILIDPSR